MTIGLKLFFAQKKIVQGLSKRLTDTSAPRHTLAHGLYTLAIGSGHFRIALVPECPENLIYSITPLRQCTGDKYIASV